MQLRNPHAPPVAALVISGPPGVGKTSVAWELFDACIHRGLHSAMVDLDLLGATWPPPNDDPYHARLKARNLADVWQNFSRAGSRRLIIAGVVETRSDVDLLAEAVGTTVDVCQLVASDETYAARIRGRGRETGPEIEKLTARALQLSLQLRESGPADFRIQNEGRTSGDTASVLLDLWLERGSGMQKP